MFEYLLGNLSSRSLSSTFWIFFPTSKFRSPSLEQGSKSTAQFLVRPRDVTKKKRRNNSNKLILKSGTVKRVYMEWKKQFPEADSQEEYLLCGFADPSLISLHDSLEVETLLVNWSSSSSSVPAEILWREIHKRMVK